jgi:hypothetical protein
VKCRDRPSRKSSFVCSARPRLFWQLIYSDELFGIDRLDESISRACSQHSYAPDEGINRIVRAVQEYSGYTAPRDDQTLLVATFDDRS